MVDQSRTRKFLRFLDRLIPVLMVAAIVAVSVFRVHVVGIGRLLLRERNGCSFGNAVTAVSYTAQHRSLEKQLREQSRVIERSGDGLCLWATPRGRYWAPTEDQGHFFVLAEMQLEPYGLRDVTIRKGDIVVDCGAYLGHFTREALDAGASRVIAVEPGTRQATCLRRTFASEIAAGRVQVLQEGVWLAEGRLMFRDAASPGASFVEAGVQGAQSSVAGVSVPVTTIDALAGRLSLDRIDLIKMDIEGSEQEALKGAVRTLARFKPRLAIAGYHKPTDPDAIPVLVRAANAGYRFTSVGCRLDLDQIRPLTLFFY